MLVRNILIFLLLSVVSCSHPTPIPKDRLVGVWYLERREYQTGDEGISSVRLFFSDKYFEKTNYYNGIPIISTGVYGTTDSKIIVYYDGGAIDEFRVVRVLEWSLILEKKSDSLSYVDYFVR